MAKQSLQEKFQASFPYKGEDGENWASVQSQRRPSRENGGYASHSIPNHVQNQSNRMIAKVAASAAAQDPPTWTDMQESTLKQDGGMRMSTAGDTDQSKQVMTRNALRDGFTYIGMSGTDDQYTGENMDHFYGEAVGNDDAGNRVTGFVERNNYLDRE